MFRSRKEHWSAGKQFDNVRQLDPGAKQRFAQIKSADQYFVGPASRQIGMVGWANKPDKIFKATKPPNPRVHLQHNIVW